MIIQYNIVLTIINLTNNGTSKFSKVFETDLSATGALLYNNYHILSEGVYVLDMFNDEVSAYCTAMGVTKASIEIDEFEIVSLSERTDVFFESEGENNSLSLRPIIKCYVYPQYDALKIPSLTGVAYDSNTIIWSWPDDEEYAHYLVKEAIDPNNEASSDQIIAQLPIGAVSYTETGLEANTAYTRRLINYTDEQTSSPSPSVTVTTETAQISQSLEEYSVPKNYDFTTDDNERELIQENLEAFHSGVGDFTDLKVYKQMDADFYQKFKAYFELTGRRIQREKRYDQVGFNYKICLEAQETIEEQEGEVTFDLNFYPREWVSIQQYMHSSMPIKVYAKLYANILLRKEISNSNTIDIEILKEKWEPQPDKIITIPNLITPKPIWHEGTDGTPPVPGTPITTFIGSPMRIVFALDATLSMYKKPISDPEGYSARDTVRAAVTNCIGKIDTLANEIKAETGTKPEILYKIITYTSNRCGINTSNQTSAIRSQSIYMKAWQAQKWLSYGHGHHADAEDEIEGEGLDRLPTINDIPGLEGPGQGGWGTGYDLMAGNTSWYGPLEVICNDLLNEGSDKTRVCYFFSDGCPNVRDHGLDYGAMEQYMQDEIVAQLEHVGGILRQRTNKIACVLFNNGGNSIISYGTTYTQAYRKRCYEAIIGTDPSKGVVINWDNQSDINTATTEFMNSLKKIEIIGGSDGTPGTDGYFTYPPPYYGEPTIKRIPQPDKFVGFETELVSIPVSTSLDSVKSVHIETPLLGPFEFNKTKTPIIYDKDEKRAIIDPNHIILPFQEKMSNTSIYDLLLTAAQGTPEWADGYNLTVGTADGSYLIKGLAIKDTYVYSDEDFMTSDIFDGSDLEDGRDGTVNVYTNIDALDSTTFADDYYLVSRSNYVYIDGYTDGIIYDGERYASAELNAYSRPKEVLIEKGADYRNELFCRKNPSIGYTGEISEIKSVVTILEIDNDILFSGLMMPTPKCGDVIFLDSLTEDILAYIVVSYSSPILNYRFNLEDPDAKTSYYEIMPKSDPKMNYKGITILHIYYARNIWVSKHLYYIESFGDSPIATPETPYIDLVEGMNAWTLMEWKDGAGIDNGRYIDNYLWFMAKPMIKTQKYYDELPGPGVDTFYGLVNGRYRTDNQDGKKDLVVDTPQFNIPTTVDKNTVKIYIIVSESHPENALISYKWEHPWNNKDSITNKNGDYVTFSCDSVTYKDVEYYDVISTINMQNQEIFNQKTTEKIYSIPKPNTVYEYINYYLKVTTDNSDVLVMRYPTEITFDESNEAAIGVSFKGVINATSQWAPRIHNGYYYLNQHEYFAYSEFDVIANFDTLEEVSFKEINGYVSFDVLLRHIAKPVEHYSIIKNTRSELLQDEDLFQWVNDKGITLKPIIDGEFYREYVASAYYTPIILFPNVLTEAGVLNIDYQFDDASEYLPMEVRSYNLEEGKWGEWALFHNNTIPTVPLSCAYQARFTLQASVQNFGISFQDYMCCYLDWKDDMSINDTTNIVTITDHMTTGPDKSKGVYVSKIIDYGCETTFRLDIFDSDYNERCQLLICYSSNNPDKLLIENIVWMNVSLGKEYIMIDEDEVPILKSNNVFTGRYFRYKIVVPEDEKLYWLHKTIKTLETIEILPYVSGVSMDGTYSPASVSTNFINTESFKIPKDGKSHTIFERVIDVIGSDIINKGYTKEEVESITIQCTTENVRIDYDQNLSNPYPAAYFNTPIKATSDIDFEVIVKNTPFIFVEKDSKEMDLIVITGTPQQYCPITVEDENSNSFIELHNTDSFTINEERILTERTKYVELKENRYDPETFNVYVDDVLLDIDDYKVINHLLIFNDFIEIGHTIKLSYSILYSFIPFIDRVNNTTKIYLYTGQGIPMPSKVKVYFETGLKNNKFIANDLSLNPIYRTDYKGFIYLTDEHNEPYKINIYCNPLRLKFGGFDKVDVMIEVLDIQDNPVISKDVAVDCNFGILNCDSFVTDMNGVIHIVYESAYMKCTDKLTARTLKDDNSAIEQNIYIINE